MLGRALPQIAASQRRPSAAGPTEIISDPPCNPIAYHALSLGVLGRAVDLLGPDAPAVARSALVRAARASWALMSPQGDVAWWGRGQAQSWTLAMTAAGAIAASDQSAAPADRARFGAAALRALDRLAGAYRSASAGIWITPAYALDPAHAIAGLDWYAASASYTGLTLLALEWLAADPAAQQPAPDVGIASDADAASLLARTGTFATVRHGPVWMAVKQCPAVPDRGRADHTHDLRYDAGVGLATLRLPDGSWVPVVRPHPITTSWDATGPVLERRGRRARMVGRNTRLATGGTVVVTTDFRTHAGATVRRARVRFTPTACGVRVAVPGRPGDIWEHSIFFDAAPRRLGRTAVRGGRVVFRATQPVTVAIRGGYASATDPHLVRAGCGSGSVARGASRSPCAGAERSRASL